MLSGNHCAGDGGSGHPPAPILPFHRMLHHPLFVVLQVTLIVREEATMLQHLNNGEHVSSHLISCKNSPSDEKTQLRKIPGGTQGQRAGIEVRLSGAKSSRMPHLFSTKWHTHRSKTLQGLRSINWISTSDENLASPSGLQNQVSCE